MTVRVVHRTRAYPGERENGDAVWVRERGDSIALAVIDATGHGPEAAKVARRSVAFLDTAPERTLEATLQGLHGELAGTRGVSIMMCRIRGLTISGVGVGNVAIRALGRSIGAVVTAGIVGHRVARIRAFEDRLAPGDRIVLWSDGISSRAAFAIDPTLPLDELCSSLIKTGARSNDDATVLVAEVNDERSRDGLR